MQPAPPEGGMVDRHALGMGAGALVTVVGIAAIASVSPVAGAGAAAIVVGLFVVFTMYLLRMLNAFGFGADQLF